MTLCSWQDVKVQLLVWPAVSLFLCCFICTYYRVFPTHFTVFESILCDLHNTCRCGGDRKAEQKHSDVLLCLFFPLQSSALQITRLTVKCQFHVPGFWYQRLYWSSLPTSQLYWSSSPTSHLSVCFCKKDMWCVKKDHIIYWQFFCFLFLAYQLVCSKCCFLYLWKMNEWRWIQQIYWSGVA